MWLRFDGIVGLQCEWRSITRFIKDVAARLRYFSYLIVHVFKFKLPLFFWSLWLLLYKNVGELSLLCVLYDVVQFVIHRFRQYIYGIC